jgi:hypothetical protein
MGILRRLLQKLAMGEHRAILHLQKDSRLSRMSTE